MEMWVRNPEARRNTVSLLHHRVSTDRVLVAVCDSAVVSCSSIFGWMRVWSWGKPGCVWVCVSYWSQPTSWICALVCFTVCVCVCQWYEMNLTHTHFLLPDRIVHSFTCFLSKMRTRAHWINRVPVIKCPRLPPSPLSVGGGGCRLIR